jgi:hypothetical protein
MQKIKFTRLPEFEDTADTSKLDVGDCFLYGSSVINQKHVKKDGDEICYYQVISKSEMGIEYTPVFDILVDKGEEKK